MIKIITCVLMLFGAVGSALAFGIASYTSPPDPFVLPELSPTDMGWTDTQFSTIVSPTPTINPARDLVLVIAGEGNSGAMNFDKTTPASPVHSLNVNVYDGATYQGADPWLGQTTLCNNSGVAGCASGTWLDYLCDTILADGNAANVYVVPLSVFQSKASDWGSGVLSTRIPVALGRLVARQDPAIPLTVYVLWGQGESDNGVTSKFDYETAMIDVQRNAANALPAGWTLKLVVAQETWVGGVIDVDVAGAQAAMVGLTPRTFNGPNADARGTKYRLSGVDDPTNTYWCGVSCPLADPTTFNGAQVYAQDWVTILRPIDPLF